MYHTQRPAKAVLSKEEIEQAMKAKAWLVDHFRDCKRSLVQIARHDVKLRDRDGDAWIVKSTSDAWVAYTQDLRPATPQDMLKL